MSFKPGLLLTQKRSFKRLAWAPAQRVVPSHLDARSRLLPSSDQGQTSECVAYAMAGWIEFYRWKFFGKAEQIDPHPIYRRAKLIDRLGGEGTTLEAGLQAAIELKLIDKVDAERVREVHDPVEVQQALHRYDVMVGAFQVTDQWMNAKGGGWVHGGGKVLGGHAVLLTGYSMREHPPYYQFQNSWGVGQGWRGFNRISPALFVEQFQYGLVWDL